MRYSTGSLIEPAAFAKTVEPKSIAGYFGSGTTQAVQPQHKTRWEMPGGSRHTAAIGHVPS
jgi:hypothetical protein